MAADFLLSAWAVEDLVTKCREQTAVVLRTLAGIPYLVALTIYGYAND